MQHYAGIDVSLESASVCVVDANGRIVRRSRRHNLYTDPVSQRRLLFGVNVKPPTKPMRAQALVKLMERAPNRMSVVY